MRALQAHNYTGNVRELINILQRAMTMCDGSMIEVDDLLLESLDAPAPPTAAEPAEVGEEKSED